MREVEYYGWGLGSRYENYANEASARGDWLGAGYYNYLSAEYDHAGRLALRRHGRAGLTVRTEMIGGSWVSG